MMEKVGRTMVEHGFDTVIVRFGGEIGIKAEWTRRLYERRLLTNIKAVLRHYSLSDARFFRRFGRLYIKINQAEKAADKLAKVFGVSSLSPALETGSSLNSILDTSAGLARLRFKARRSFAVRCRRVGKHPYTSQDICREVGQEILTRLPQLKLWVDLSHPQQALNIEIREDKAYVFTDIIKAAGGLPLGTQSKTVCLLKGDAQSAAACWMTMKRGCAPILLHVLRDVSGKYADVKRVKRTVEKLSDWAIGFPLKLRLIRCSLDLASDLGKQPQEPRSLVRKRLLLKIAEAVAEKHHAEGIVTGEVLGTSRNLTPHTFRVSDEAVKNHPVLRPLIGFGLDDIKRIAGDVGVGWTASQRKSKATHEDASAIELEDVERIERELNIRRLVVDSAKTAEVLDFSLR